MFGDVSLGVELGAVEQRVMIRGGTAGLGTADRIFSATVFAGVVETSKTFQTALRAEDGLRPFGWIPCEKFGVEFDRMPRCCTDETGGRLCLFACWLWDSYWSRSCLWC